MQKLGEVNGIKPHGWSLPPFHETVVLWFRLDRVVIILPASVSSSSLRLPLSTRFFGFLRACHVVGWGQWFRLGRWLRFRRTQAIQAFSLFILLALPLSFPHLIESRHLMNLSFLWERRSIHRRKWRSLVSLPKHMTRFSLFPPCLSCFFYSLFHTFSYIQVEDWDDDFLDFADDDDETVAGTSSKTPPKGHLPFLVPFSIRHLPLFLNLYLSLFQTSLRLFFATHVSGWEGLPRRKPAGAKVLILPLFSS